MKHWMTVVLFLGVAGLVRAQDPKPAPPAEKPKTQEPKREQDVTIFGAESPLNAPDLFNAKYSGDVVEDDWIRNRAQSRSLPDALRETPGVGIQKTGPGQGSPFIRGLTGFRNLMLIDGIRLNNSTFREGPNQYWNTVDSFLINRMDVIRGPASMMYSSDAMGGTVYVHTLDPFQGDEGFHSRTIGRYSTGEHSLALREELSGHTGDFGVIGGVTYRDFGDIRGGDHVGRMNNTYYNEYAADLKVSVRVSDHATLTAAVQAFRQNEAPRWHRTSDSPSWHGTAAGTEIRDDFDQERDLAYIQYHWASEGGIVDALTASLSWQRQAEDEMRAVANGNVQQREFEVDTPGFFIQAGKKTGWGYFTFGGEVYYDDVDSDGYNRTAAGVVTELDRGSVADDARYLLYGIFIQDEFTLGSLDIAAGIRYTGAKADANQVDPQAGIGAVVPGFDDTYSAVTGSLRFLYHVDEHWNLIAGWGMGFRTPSLDDTTSTNFVLTGAGQDLPSTDLDPETSHTFDLGVRTRYDTVEVSAFGFYTRLDDFIQRVNVGDQNGDGSADFAKENMDNGWIYGFELSVDVRVTPEWTAWARGGYAVGEVDQVVTLAPEVIRSEPLGKVEPAMLILGLRYAPAEAGFWVEALATFTNHQKRLSVSDLTDTQRIPPGGTPGYTIYTLRGGYRVCPNFTLTAAIENISNKDYRVHGSGQNEPGLNAIFGADLRF